MRFSWLLIAGLAGCTPAAELQLAAVTEQPAATTLEQVSDSPTMDRGAELVEAHCSACHSLSMIAQNRMSRENWKSTIRWMQEKQGLWDLGDSERIILDYLERNHGVVEVPWRRKPLEIEGSE